MTNIVLIGDKEITVILTKSIEDTIDKLKEAYKAIGAEIVRYEHNNKRNFNR